MLQQAYNVLKVSLKNFYTNYIKNKDVQERSWFSWRSHFTQEGGELYFSDMYASKVVPDHMKQDPVLWGKKILHCHLKIQCKGQEYSTESLHHFGCDLFVFRS